MLRIEGRKIYLACDHTDMRKSIDGLSAIVQSSFKLDPLGSGIFVFCNKNRNRLKILEWDGDGFWIHLKRLENGRFKWPKSTEEEKTMVLSHEELGYLLGSTGLEQKLKRKQVSEKIII